MSKSNNVPPKAAKVLGIGQAAKKPTGLAGLGAKITGAKTGGTTANTFKKAEPKTSGKMKPTTPIIGTNRGGTPANFATINKERMKSAIKKTGIGGM